ncbi:efflux RND transporter periplasmic adaptor subunit [Synechococcus sp. RedBA-s]|nr:efflux RND transporter periplasmic adaptor subunit [Synechococcus sp. RedBA-s]
MCLPWPASHPGCRILSGSVLVGLAVALVACQPDPSKPLPKPLAVSVQAAGSHSFPEEISSISTLEAPEEVSLAAQAGGRIQSLRIRQGDQVRQGQLLVVLDQTQLQEEVKALQGQRDESLLNYQRFDYLQKQGAASAIQRDALRQNFIAAEAGLKAKQADLAYKDLRAPIDGVVSDVAVKPGDVIRAGTPFTTIQRTSRLLARLEVPSRYGRQVRPGQPVLLNTPSGTGMVEGRVVSIDPRVNDATQTFLVKAELDNPAGEFRNGERVRTRLMIGTRPQLAVPALAVTRTSGQTFVFVMGSLSDLERLPGNAPIEKLRTLPPSTRFSLKQPVKLGPLQDNRYPVLKGLQSGQAVIVSNLFSLRHGMTVTVR